MRKEDHDREMLIDEMQHRIEALERRLNALEARESKAAWDDVDRIERSLKY